MRRPLFKIKPVNHIFKTAGAIGGLATIGFFGFIFGFTGGALIDQLILHFREKVRLKNFFKQPESIIEIDNNHLQSFIEASAVAAAFFLCTKDSSKIEVLSSIGSFYFPEAPENTNECLQDMPEPDFRALSAFFGRTASAEQKKKLNGLIDSLGLKQLLLHIMSEDPDSKTAEIITAADFMSFSSPADGCLDENSKAADYALLGLGPGASKDEIKRVYYNLAAHFHPDAGADLSAEQRKITEDAFKKINSAYERIK